MTYYGSINKAAIYAKQVFRRRAHRDARSLGHPEISIQHDDSIAGQKPDKPVAESVQDLRRSEVFQPGYHINSFSVLRRHINLEWSPNLHFTLPDTSHIVTCNFNTTSHAVGFTCVWQLDCDISLRKFPE